MAVVRFYRRKVSKKTRKIIMEFVSTGCTPNLIAAKYGMSRDNVTRIFRLALSVDGIGSAPERCRLGVYAGFKNIIEPILRANGVTWPQAIGHSRINRIVKCRWEIWAALNDAGKAYANIGRFFERHHTTIMAGVRCWRGHSHHMAAE